MKFTTQQTIVLILLVNITAAIGAFGFGYLQDAVGHVRAVAITLVGWIVMVVLAGLSQSSTTFWIAANLAGIPAMSLPGGFVNGLPVGVQLMGNFFDEARLLNVAHQYQQATEWHRRMPKGFE